MPRSRIGLWLIGAKGGVATTAMTGLAAETFNDGLRAYYFSFATMGWFFSPLFFVVNTLVIVAILYNREFHSDVLKVFDDGN